MKNFTNFQKYYILLSKWRDCVELELGHFVVLEETLKM